MKLDDFDRDDVSAEIEHLLLRHPIVSKHEWGSAVGAKIAQMIEPLEECHPQSIRAMQYQAIIEGVVEAVLRRLQDDLGWTPNDKDRLRYLLFDRRREGVCEGLMELTYCGKKTLPADSWCKDCEARLKAEVKEDEASA